MFFTSLIITFPTFTCLFWASLFLLEYKSNPREKKLMFWFMLTAMFLYFGHFCYFSKAYEILPITDTLYSYANLAVYPIYYLYVRYITTNKLEIQRCLWCLLPAILIAASNLLAYSFGDGKEIQAFIYEYLYHEDGGQPHSYLWLYLNHVLARGIFTILLFVSIGFCYQMTKQFNLRLKESYSNNEGRNLNSIMILQVSLAIASVASGVLNFLGKSFFVDSVLLAFPSMIFSSLLFAIGYDAYRRTFTASMFEQEQQMAIIPADSGNEKEEPDLAVRLIGLLKEQQLYLQPDLKITDLAQALATNRNYVYVAIKNQLNTNFSDLINKMRIEHALRLMDETPSAPLAEIALQSGYVSESSFYRNFKKVTGVTPTERRKVTS